MNTEFLNLFDFDKKLSLYIHIPFCKSKCSYCAFFSKSGITDEIKKKYVEKLVSEIETVSFKMSKPFSTAFLGGGNPGCLDVHSLEKICKAVCRNGRPEEFTTEMNPESFSDDCSVLFEKYFTRLSMGVQSFDEYALKFLGRNASLEDTERGLEKAFALRKKTGIKINCDLITCLGDFHDAKADAKHLVEKYNPDHISLYALSIEEGTKLYKEKVSIPSSDEQYEILSNVWEYLTSSGYEHYEVSNFAKPGCKSIHNSVYWSYGQYLGLGCGAASTAHGKSSYFRCDVERSIEKYVSSERFENIGIEKLSLSEALEEFVFMGLRHKTGLDLRRLREEFGYDLPVLPKHFSVIDGFLVPDEDGLMTADAAALDILGKLS